MTTTNKNKILACRFLELLSSGNVDELCKMVSPSWTMQGSITAMPAGAAGVRKLFESYENIEQQWSVDELVAEGNKVVVKATNSFVQYSFFGIAHNGKRQTFTAVFIHHIENGKILKTWCNGNEYSRLLQPVAKLQAL